MVNGSSFGWSFWAVMSAAFAALTAIFAKIGVGDINSDLATLIRTAVVLTAILVLVVASGEFQSVGAVPVRAWAFLVLSGLATGASWLCYFRALKLGPASRVAPVDKLSVVLVAVFGVVFLGEKLSAPNWLGVVMIAAGALLIAWKG